VKSGGVTALNDIKTMKSAEINAYKEEIKKRCAENKKLVIFLVCHFILAIACFPIVATLKEDIKDIIKWVY